MNPQHYNTSCMSRREMLTLARNGFGSLALYGLCANSAKAQSLSPKVGMQAIDNAIPNYTAKAKSIIFLYMDGGVSQVDSFDPKPRLAKENGANPYDKFKVDATQFNSIGKIMKSPWDFKQYGESGMWFSDLFPHIATCADDIAMINSMYSDFPEHTNANYYLHTGTGIQGRPSMGAWVTYGLGNENKNLPGYVVLNGGLTPPGGLDNFKNGFLPGTYQASVFRPTAAPLANIKPLENSAELQNDKMKFLHKMDQSLLNKIGDVDQVESTITNYELAYKMQSSIPELADMSGETAATRKLYGLDDDDKNMRGYAAQCLLARRLVERGVRFIELTCPNCGYDRWDQHANLEKGHKANAHAVDQPIAGLIKDLKSRGLFEETLIIFSGEFGRTPFGQTGSAPGRDHNPQAFSTWMAGAGINGGLTYGSTDEYGYRVIENKTSIHDMHATMLHLLGIDHIKQTYRFSGRDIRLTDVHGHIIHDILA